MTQAQSLAPSPCGTCPHYLATVLLAGLAGWVDAVSFVSWNGLYVSFMSGNTTSLAVSLGSHHWGEADRRASVLAAFVVGWFAENCSGDGLSEAGRNLLPLRRRFCSRLQPWPGELPHWK
jgi:hypothetical protein